MSPFQAYLVVAGSTPRRLRRPTPKRNTTAADHQLDRPTSIHVERTYTQAPSAVARVQLDPSGNREAHHTDSHEAAAPLRRLAIANHTSPLTSSKIPIASHGHG